MEKTNKLYFYSLLIAIITMLNFTGCDKFLNEAASDPNTLTNVPIKQRISPLMGGYAFELFGGFPARISANWTQQITYNGDTYYYKLDSYQLGQPWADFSGVWTTVYSDIAKNAKFTYQEAQKEGYPHIEGIARVMFAWTMANMTNWYGSIPFSDAFRPEINKPKFDSQKNIYPKLLAILDSAITSLKKTGKVKLKDNDLIYNGDIAKWIRLAYTVKARFLMQLTEAPDNKKQERATKAIEALSHGFQNNDDSALFPYSNTNDERNPWYMLVIYSNLDNVQMSAHYIKLLKSLNDPRLPIQANVAVKHKPGQKYIGNRNGASGVSVDSISDIGSAYTAPNAPGRLLTYSDAKFLEAQAKLITSGPAAADTPYREAIRANMKALGVSSSDIDKYINKREKLAASSNSLKDILIQKYIANFLNPQAWNDWRKTGYPILSPSYHSKKIKPNFDAIPRRYPWATTVMENNKKNAQALGLPSNYNVMQVPVWWDTRQSDLVKR
jgi:hypothetical protein